MKLFHRLGAALNRPLSLRREPSLKLLVTVCLLGGAFATTATLAVYEGLRDTNEVLSNRPDRFLKAGTVMDDFTLPSTTEGHEVSLAKLRAEGKPVVLLFGSFTCTIFQSHRGRLEHLYHTYQDRANFLFVNVHEAGHPIEGFGFLLQTSPDGELTLEQRRENVLKATKLAGFTVPTVVDIDRTVERSYSAYPLRLVVLDPKGQVALDLGNATQGPWDFKQLEEFLNKQDS